MICMDTWNSLTVNFSRNLNLVSNVGVQDNVFKMPNVLGMYLNLEQSNDTNI